MWTEALLSLTLGVAVVLGLGTENSCVPSKCIILNNCRCALTGPRTPGGLTKPHQIPQFVALTFQGKIFKEANEHLKKIFKEERKNDDGCLQKATFFIPGKENDWVAVKEWYKAGHEIGAYSYSYSTEQSHWRKIGLKTIKEEAKNAKEAIKNETEIPASKVRGWRTPLLEFGGDDMMQGLRSSGFEYDSTLKIPANHKIWPFTMDHGWPFENCLRYTNACIKKANPGFWEFPVIIHDINGAEMATFSRIQSENTKDIVKMMKESFNSYYLGDKAPFMMTFSTSYFTGDLAKVRTEALEEFLMYLEEQRDVYVTTLYDILQWIKLPKKAGDMKDTCNKKAKDGEDIKFVSFDYNKLTRYQLFLYYYGRRSNAVANVAAIYTTAMLSLAIAFLRFF